MSLIFISLFYSGDKENFAETAEIVASIPAEWKMKPSYYHSFSMTENYYIIVEAPLVLNLIKLLTSKIRRKAFNTAMEWHPNRPVCINCSRF